MKKLIVLFLFLTTALFAKIGEISAMHGEATILRDGKSIPVSSHMAIEEKDTIKTAKNTKLQIIFNDNTIISLGQKSTFKIEAYLFSKTKVKARFNVKGLFKSITGKIGHIAPENFKLKTQNATIGVRGTTIIGESHADADTIICSSGKIIVSTLKGDIIVNRGERTIVHRDARPTRPSIIKKEMIQKTEQKIILSQTTPTSMLQTPANAPLKKQEPIQSEISTVKEEKQDWGVWDEVDTVSSTPETTPTPLPIVEEELESLALLREKAGTKTPSYHGEVSGFVNTPLQKISDGHINLNVDLGRGKVDGDIGFNQGSDRWQADIHNGSVDRHGALDFAISNQGNLKGSGDGMLSGEHLEHANGTFKIKNETNNQNAYGTFKARR